MDISRTEVNIQRHHTEQLAIADVSIVTPTATSAKQMIFKPFLTDQSAIEVKKEKQLYQLASFIGKLTD
jgi:hypothetical protein